MRKGYLTVYLSLTLAVMVSLILALIEGARFGASRMQSLCAADISINSVLSEYNKELLRQYDLIFLDTTYCGSSNGISAVNNRLSFYLKKNLDEGTPVLSRDLLGLKYDSSAIEEYALATDNDAEAVRRQVADYMNTTLKGALTSGLDDLTGQLSSAHYDYDVDARRAEAQAEIDAIGPPTRINEDNEEEEVAIDNPADVANSARSGGILGTVLNDTSGISRSKINAGDYISNRAISTGNGISDQERKCGQAAGKLAYDEYIFDKCGYYMHPKEGSRLNYEIEYIIKNNDNDWDNLEDVSQTICRWREGVNFVYLESDAGRRGEAEAMAEALAAVMLSPELAEPITVSILLAWAYVESLQDVKILLEGDGVPVVKSNENWHTAITDILTPRAALRSYPGQSGEKYGDYLKTMLAMKGYGETVAKSMDVMEMDIRLTSGNAGFKMDCCMQSFLVDIKTKSTHGHRTEVRRRSGYYYP